MDPHSLKSILVATDLREGSEEIVRSAGRLAAATGAELHALHALDLGSPPYGTVAEGAIPTMPERLEQAHRALAEQVAELVPDDVPVRTHVADHAAHAAIVERAAEISADLIVLGPHEGRDLGARVVGTTADRVLRTAEVPCLLVRRPLELPIRRIGVAVDFSEPSRGAVEAAVTLAGELGAAPGGDPPTGTDLVVFHVGWSIDREGNPPLTEEELVRRLQEEVKATLEQSGQEPPARLRLEVSWAASPRSAIIAHAEEREMDLLVLGTHGYGGAARILLGSVASGVARSATCSVLLVPPALSHRMATGPQAWKARARLERVLIATDLSPSSAWAAEWVVHYFAPGADHRFVHVLDLEEPPAFLGGPTKGREAELRATREAADRELRSLARSLIGEEAVELREGSASGEISRAAHDWRADVLAVGEHGRRGIKGWIGSTAERLLVSAPAPVLLVKESSREPPSRLLAAVDDSDLSHGVLTWARVLAERFAAGVHVFHALDAVRYGAAYSMGAAPPLAASEEDRAKALHWLEERVREAGLSANTVDVEVVAGDAAASLIEAATRTGADLLVMGSRGARAAGRLLLGSTSRAAIRQAPCSVLVVTKAS